MERLRQKVEIEVINWEKYNPRTDRKNHTWFRLENSIVTEPKFFGLSAAQKFVAVCLFAEATKGHGKAIIHIEWLQDQLKVEQFDIVHTIQYLAECGVIRLPTGNRLPQIDSLRTNERTNDTIRTNDTDAGLPTGSSTTPKEPSHVSQVKKAFLESYKKEFKRDYPGWGAKENGMASKWLKSVSLDDAKRLCDLYPKWNDPWVTKQGHPLGILMAQYVQLDAWAQSTPQLIKKIAAGKAAENVDLKRAVDFEEMKRGLKHTATRQQTIENPSSIGRLQKPIPLPTTQRILGERGDPFGAEIFDPPSESDFGESL